MMNSGRKRKNLCKISMITAIGITLAVSSFFVFSETQELEAAVAVATASNGAYGVGVNRPDTSKAGQRAIIECTKYSAGCRIIHTDGSKGWGALARNEDTGRIGVATGKNTRQAAEQRALQECGHGCRIRLTWNDIVGTQ